MCRRIVCHKCNKPTYAGCGMHIEEVLGDVPADARCACRTEGAAGGDGIKDLIRRFLGR